MKPLPGVDPGVTRRLVAAGVVSLVAWAALEFLSPRLTVAWSGEMLEAAARMRVGLSVVANHLGARPAGIDDSMDPNRTGLIGPEYTELFTSLGQLEAKRTTTNPDVAALMVHLLRRAGVGEGDTIAVGASASFPALLIAAQAAAEVMGVHPVTILSLGASSYGATRPDFTLVDMHRLLVEEGALSTPAAALSLGGEGDVGGEFEASFRDRLLEEVRAGGIPLVDEPELRANVTRRMGVYLGADLSRQPSASPGRLSAFVNIGGNAANLGASPMVLSVEPGLNARLPLPAEEERGVIHEMAARGVPVIHLLHIRGLALRHGLPWDPIPLPEPGATPLTVGEGDRRGPFWLVTGAYLAALALIAGTGRSPRVRQPG